MRHSIAVTALLALLNWAMPASGRESAAARKDAGPSNIRLQSRVVDLEITPEWSIRIPPSPHRALVRAAEDLRAFLRDRHRLDVKIDTGGQGCGFILAVKGSEHADCISLRTVQAERQVVVEGSSPRAVYQGVLLLEDRLAARPVLPSSLAEAVTFPFGDRYLFWDSLLTGQNKDGIGFDLERHVREAVRLGYTGMECNRFVGTKLLQQGHPRDPYPWYTYWGPSMDQFVTSPLFEGVFPTEYLERNLADLKRIVDVVASFGLKPLFTGYEPRYVPDDFLRRRPELRGPRVDHPLRSMAARYSLCTDRPEVLDHYRTLARRLMEEVPGVREMRVIFHDSGTGLCWADGLYSGRNGPEHCRDVPAGERMRDFFTAIKQGLQDGGRDVHLVVQPHGISRPEIDAFFAAVPKDIGFTAGNWASWSLCFRDPLEVDRYVLSRQLETGRSRLYYQQHFFGFDVAPTAEYPLPYCLAERLKTVLGLGLDRLDTLGGIVSPPVKARSAMQEVYRQFLLEPNLPVESLVERVACDLGGKAGGEALLEIWKDVHAALEKNGRQIGFAMGTEYASRRTLVRPLVPEPSALSAGEREWWLAFTFGGNLRFGHAHLFRGEGGPPTQEWYKVNFERAERAKESFQRACSRLQAFLREHPEAGRAHPYLTSHERQLRFIAHVYGTGANLYEGQRILDKYSKKEISEELSRELNADLADFKAVVEGEIENTKALLEFLEEGGEIGMVLLPEETTWGYSRNLPEILRRKIEIMNRRLPEAEAVLKRWFGAEY